MTRGVLGGALFVCVCVCALCVLAAPVGGTGGTQSAENVTATATTSAEEVFVTRTVDVTVTVSNDRADAVSVYGARLVGDDGSVRRLAPGGRVTEIEPGDSVELVFEDVRVAEPGRNVYTAEIEAVPDDDPDTRVESTAEVTVVGDDPAPVVDVTAAPGDGPTERVLDVALGNANDGELRRVGVSVRPPPGSGVTILDRSGAVPVIAPGESRSLSFDLRVPEPGTYQFRVVTAFETADGDVWNRTERVPVSFAKTRVTVPANASGVRLTGLSAQGVDSVAVSGRVSNTGAVPLTGVTIAVADAPGVTASGVQFLGTVDPGSFSPFDVIEGRVEDRETVPVEVQYTIGDTRYRTVVEVDPSSESGGGGGVPAFDDDDANGDDDGGDGGDGGGSPVGGLGLLVLGVGGVLVAGAGAVVYRRRG
jgi:hypothetical protein